METSELSRRSLFAFGGVSLLALAACGSSGGGQSIDDVAGSGTLPAREPGVVSGIVREPFPVVDTVSLPSLTTPGDDFVFRADPGEVTVVYFGFTNCPDVCPTTLADLTVALRKLDQVEPGLSERVETVMVTVDPDRDLEILPQYITSFVSDAIAVGTTDTDLLARAGEPFGLVYDVRTLDDGTVEVDHSPFLYAVDDQGRLVLTWQFGVSSDDMAADLAILLERAAA